jgi:hypothetical protein
MVTHSAIGCELVDTFSSCQFSCMIIPRKSLRGKGIAKHLWALLNDRAAAFVATLAKFDANLGELSPAFGEIAKRLAPNRSAKRLAIVTPTRHRGGCFMTDITSAASAMGKKGGVSKSIAKQRASRANLARANAAKRRTAPAPEVPTVEQLRRVVAVPAPSNRRPPKPQPATVPDEMAQEDSSDDFTT